MLNGRVPSYFHFYHPILKVLAKTTERQADVFVDCTVDLIKSVIHTAGFDPDNLGHYGKPTEGWCFEGKCKPVGMRKKVIIAYLQMHRLREPLTVKGSYGKWAITEAGLKKLAAWDAAPNATSIFLAKRLKETRGGLFKTIKYAVAANMRVSSATSQLDDHVQTCLLRLISRDSLRTRILMDLPIRDNHIAHWAVRSAYADARNDGTEPVAREFHGARTEGERNGATLVHAETISDNRVIWNSDAGDVAGHDAGTWADIVDTASSFRATVSEDEIFFNDLWGQVSETIIARCGGERHVQAMQMQMDGHSLQEIAHALSVTKARVSVMLTEARETAKLALAQSGVSLAA